MPWIHTDINKKLSKLVRRKTAFTYGIPINKCRTEKKITTWKAQQKWRYTRHHWNSWEKYKEEQDYLQSFKVSPPKYSFITEERHSLTVLKPRKMLPNHVTEVHMTTGNMQALTDPQMWHWGRTCITFPWVSCKMYNLLLIIENGKQTQTEGQSTKYLISFLQKFYDHKRQGKTEELSRLGNCKEK